MRRQDEESSQEEEYEDRLSDDDEEESDEYEYDSEEYSDEDDEEDSEVESKAQPETSGSNLVDDGGTENMEKSNKNFQAKPPEMPAIPSDVSDMQPLLQKASSWGGPRSSWASIESIGSMEDGEGPVRRPRPVLRRCRTDEPRKSVSFAEVLEEIYEVAMLKMDEDPEVSHFHQLTDAQGQCQISSDASKVSQPAAAVPKITMDERPSVVCSVTQVSQGVSKAAGLDNTKVPEALKQSSVPQSVQPNPEQARAVDNLKPPLQRGILQPFASRSDSSTESQVQLPSNPKGPFDHHFQQSGLREGGLGYEMSQPVVNQASKVLQESPKFGNDITDMTDTHIPSQPRIGRVGSLPEPYQRPRGPGILKKAKTESFVERPKTLRFAAEAEIREISPCSPCSPCSPSPLAQAVVVGTPVDPGYIHWRQWEHRSAALSADKPGPFGVLPPKTGSAATSWATSSARPLEGDILQRGRSRSMSLLPDLPEPPSEKGAPVSKEPDFEAASKQAPEAWQGHQTPEKPQTPQATQESRFHNPKEMMGTSQASASNSQAGFKVRVEHRGPQEGHNASSECQASSTPSTPSVPSQSSASAASGFLVWKKPSTCEPGPTSMRSSASSVQSFGVSDQGNQGNQRNHGSQNPIATLAQYFYQITLPSGLEEAELHGSTSQAAPALQTTVNCSNELTEMYTRHRGSHRSRKSHRRPEQTATATPSPPQCGVRENISASPPDDFKVPKVAYEWGHFSPDFERRVLERAYFQYMNGVSEDEVYNYFEALRIELGQRPADL